MIVVTGVAGFIGSHVARHLLAAGAPVIGIDSMNNYYDPALKKARLDALQRDFPKLIFIQLDLSEPHGLEKALAPYAADITHFIHLAAQAGVRYSIEAPRSYISANINGQMEVLEWARAHPHLQHLVYASSSSVYGNSSEQPFHPTQNTDHPISLYAATKKAGEVLTDSYAHLYGVKSTGLRFFTVYGPWGRPDMAYFKFTKAIVAGQPIQVYNYGDMRRDFTFIDDIVGGIAAVLRTPPSGPRPHRVYNLGNHRSEQLMDMIRHLEYYLDRAAIIEMQGMQPGDVLETYADISDAQLDFGYHPKTTLQDGLKPFVAWYRSFYGV